MKRYLLFSIILLFLGAASAFAQQPGRVTGTVYLDSVDPCNYAIGATVTVVNSSQVAVMGTLVQLDGTFEVSVAPGYYTLMVIYIGYVIYTAPCPVVSNVTTTFPSIVLQSEDDNLDEQATILSEDS